MFIISTGLFPVCPIPFRPFPFRPNFSPFRPFFFRPFQLRPFPISPKICPALLPICLISFSPIFHFAQLSNFLYGPKTYKKFSNKLILQFWTLLLGLSWSAHIIVSAHSQWAPADYIHNREVGIHVSEFRLENAILGSNKSLSIPLLLTLINIFSSE